MTEQWQELKETITELRDNDGIGTQQEVCKFLANLMDVLEKQMQEPCEDAISRQATLEPYRVLKDTDTLCVALIRANIMQQPPVNVLKQESKTGHWIDTDEWRETIDGFEQWGYFRKCSRCGYVFKFLEIDNYCPNCGCRMIEPQAGK